MDTALFTPETSNAFDPVTLEVVRYKLEGIANEMQSTLLRSSFSPVVKEALDASASLFSIQGETLSQALAIPNHLATLIPVVDAFLKAFPVPSMREGDVYIMNEPYMGGTHLPDIGIVTPIFVDGRVVAFSATMTHHQDIGGMTPGSIPTNATEIYQEGLRIPPLKLYDAGVLNETLIQVLRLNVRLPDTLVGDLNAQIAACRIGSRRMVQLMDVYGREFLLLMFEELLSHSERATRTRLAQIPDGVYRYVDYLDNDGVDLDRRVRIEVAVTIRQGTMHVDFNGTDDQVRGPLNVVESGCMAAAYFALRAVTGSDIPTNAGCFRAVSMYRPPGSLVCPNPPAPVGTRTATIKRICGCILGALKEALPDRVPADSAGVLVGLAFGGRNVTTGKPYVVAEIIVGGSGASALSDGVDVIETDATNCMNLPVEAMEMEMPVRVNRLELSVDSGGAGEHRGGLGIVKEYEFLGDSATFTHRGERHTNGASGSNGGGPGAAARSQIVRASGVIEEVQSKLVTTLRKGDRIVVQTPGGGGYGNPLDRPRDEVLLDLRDGKVSLEAARGEYGWAPQHD
jgi:N-methylhydantoinase B